MRPDGESSRLHSFVKSCYVCAYELQLSRRRCHGALTLFEAKA